MPITVKQLPGESIICATVNQPFDPEQDMPAMFAETTRLRLTIQGDVVLIIDVSQMADAPDSFSKMVFALAHASQGIRTNIAAGVGRPPILILVGSDPLTALASEAMAQDQYGGVRGHLCVTLDEALALAREKLSNLPS